MREHFQEIKYQIIFTIVSVLHVYVIVYVKSKPRFNIWNIRLWVGLHGLFCRRTLWHPTILQQL